MATVEVIPNPPKRKPPQPDYEKEYYINHITDWLCGDNKVVRGLLRQRLLPNSVERLQKIAIEQKIPLI